MTLTVNAAGHSVGATYLRVFNYTGQHATPIGATATFSSVSGTGITTLSITLGAAPATTSHVLGVFAKYDTGEAVTVGGSGGFTEIFQDELQIGWQTMQTESRSGSASTTVDWAGWPSKPSNRVAAAAIEIKEAAGGGAAPTRFSSQVIG
jgi:hypothetical protein